MPGSSGTDQDITLVRHGIIGGSGTYDHYLISSIDTVVP